MNDISLKIAGKTDVGLLRTNNEDNLQLAQDLTAPQMTWVGNTPFHLGEKGSLLVVADGMGGMNAGEVASQIAIDTIREYFVPERLTDEVLKSRFSIEKYMKMAILQAGHNIKEAAKAHPEHKGMGTTIVVAWIYKGLLYVSWVGDSRAYLYNPKHGLQQISKDHSYVQTLVDKGIITKYDAFDYPDSNVITRSLSDVGGQCDPDCLVTPIQLCDSDIVLLCSDGLNGMIRDNVIESIITANQLDLDDCIVALIEAALNAGGTDNCTVALAQILSCGHTATADRGRTILNPDCRILAGSTATHPPKRRKLAIALTAAIVLAGISGLSYKYFIPPTNGGSTKQEGVDSGKAVPPKKEVDVISPVAPSEEKSKSKTNLSDKELNPPPVKKTIEFKVDNFKNKDHESGSTKKPSTKNKKKDSHSKLAQPSVKNSVTPPEETETPTQSPPTSEEKTAESSSLQTVK